MIFFWNYFWIPNETSLDLRDSEHFQDTYFRTRSANFWVAVHQTSSNQQIIGTIGIHLPESEEKRNKTEKIERLELRVSVKQIVLTETL